MPNFYCGAEKDSDQHIQQARDHAKKNGWELKYTPSQSWFESAYFNLSDKYKFSTVYNQGKTKSCTAHALCAAYKLCLKKQGFRVFDPSRLFLYYNTRDRNRDIHEDNGASLCNSVMALNCLGVCEEKDWPFSSNKAIVTSRPPESCYSAARENNLCQYYRLEQDINHFKACLISDECPFVFTFNVSKNFNAVTRMTGVMPWPDEATNKAHSVMATGFDDDSKHIIALNSWGEDFGKDGYFRVPYEIILHPEICFDFWKIAFACRKGESRPHDTIPCPTTQCKE